jgi:hypothetical protein
MNGVYTELAEVNYELFYEKQTQTNPIRSKAAIPACRWREPSQFEAAKQLFSTK